MENCGAIHFCSTQSDDFFLQCPVTSGVNVFRSSPFHQVMACIPESRVSIATLTGNLLFAAPGITDRTLSSARRVDIYNAESSTSLGSLDIPTSEGGITHLYATAQRLVVFTTCEVFCFDPINRLHDVKPTCVKWKETNVFAVCPQFVALPGLQPHGAEGYYLCHVLCLPTLETHLVLPTKHTKPLAALSLSADGAKVATVSSGGTVVRVWSTSDGTLLHVLRRGMWRVQVNSLTFGGDKGTVLALHSDHGTIHVFDVSTAAVTSSGTEVPEQRAKYTWEVRNVTYAQLSWDAVGDVLRVATPDGWMRYYEASTQKLCGEAKFIK